MLPPNTPVNYYANKEDPWSYARIAFDGLRTQELMEQAGLTIDSPVLDSAIPNETHQQMIDKIVEQYQSNVHGEMVRAALAFQVIATMIRSHSSSRGDDGMLINEMPNKAIFGPRQYMHYASVYIDQNINTVQIATITKRLGISQSYLNQIVKRFSGYTLQGFIIHRRMARAAALLSSTSIPIKAIAEHVGYEDQLAFNKMFRKEFNLSPSEYRNRKRHSSATAETE